MIRRKRHYRSAGVLVALAVVFVLAGCPMEFESPLRAGIELAIDQATRVAAPVFTPTAGTYSRAQTVTISSATPDAIIFYTDDGSTPTTTSTQYNQELTVAGNGTSRTFKAIAVASGLETSRVAEATITISFDTVSTPQFNPPAGTYATDQLVAISSDTPGATIYYTTDGSTPSTASTEYAGPITIAGSTETSVSETLKAFAIADQMIDSTVASATHTIEYPLVSTPQFSPPGGMYLSSQDITISVTTPGASIRYTTDGSDPSPTHGTVYSGPVTVSNDATLKAAGYGPDLRTSTSEATYEVVFSGKIDRSFGTDGAVTTAVGSNNDYGNAVAIQADGKIVVVGNQGFAIARYTSSGTLDTGFGSGGTVLTSVDPPDYGRAVAIQTDGKIVAAGSAWGASGFEFALVRYTSSGALDTSFGTGGIVTTAIRTMRDEAYAVAIQSDGKIVVAGFSDNGLLNRDFAIARYETTGALDTGFGSGGTVTNAIGSANDEIHGIAIQPDGKIIVAGVSDSTFTVARYTAAGALDTAFGTGGIVTTSMGTSSHAFAVVIQSDGKIVAAGSRYSSGNDFALLRYTTSGALDATFGTGGIVTTSIGISNEAVRSIAIQSDGKFVVAGTSDTVGDYVMTLARYSTAGALDTSFGTGGIVTADIGPADDYGYAVAIQSDGKIVVAGSSDNGSGNLDFALARFWP